jgi:hypothetical protein
VIPTGDNATPYGRAQNTAGRADDPAVLAWLAGLPAGRVASPEEQARLFEAEAALAGDEPMVSHASVIAAARARFHP